MKNNKICEICEISPIAPSEIANILNTTEKRTKIAMRESDIQELIFLKNDMKFLKKYLKEYFFQEFQFLIKKNNKLLKQLDKAIEYINNPYFKK